MYNIQFNLKCNNYFTPKSTSDCEHGLSHPYKFSQSLKLYSSAEYRVRVRDEPNDIL